MESFSYFLPKSYRAIKRSSKALSVETCCQVFSRHLSEYTGQKKITDNGRSITFANINESKFSFNSYQFEDDELVQTRSRKAILETTYDHAIYCYHDEVCFLLNAFADVKKCLTKVDVSCIRFDKSGRSTMQERVLSLDYDHIFNQFSCSLSENERKIVLITGRDLDSYGRKEELADNYMDVLSFDTSASDISISHLKRKNLTKLFKVYDVDAIIFSVCGTKLFLVFGKIFLVYSLSFDVFGSLFELKDSVRYHMTKCCFYTYNKQLGNMLIMSQGDGLIYTVRESNFVFDLVDDRRISVAQLGFKDDFIRYMHIDNFNSIRIYFTISNQLFVYDYFKQDIVAKYVPAAGCYVDAVETNWCSEELFVFLRPFDEKTLLQLNIIFINRKHSLKEIAQLAILQLYSKEQLKLAKLPTNLRLEMQIF